MRQCSECHEGLPPYARFCRECGSEQPLSKELSLASALASSKLAEEDMATLDENEISEIAVSLSTITTGVNETEQSEVADKDTAIIAVMNETEQSEVADKDTAIITALSNPNRELAKYLPVPASIPHKELAEHLADPTSVPHPELFDEHLETKGTDGPTQVDQHEGQTLPVMEWPVVPTRTGDLSAAQSGKAAEEWRRSWRDLQRAEAGPALDVSRGHALVPEPLASMEDSLLRIRAIRESKRAPEKNLGFWLMLFLLITLIGMLVLLILWTYFPTGF